MAISPAAPALFPALLGCIAVFASAGCERRISAENIDAANKLQDAAQQRKSKWPGVNEGMTEKEVESILGQPELRKAGKSVEINQPVEIPTTTYIYRQDGQTIELSFLDGKLQGSIPHFGENVDSKAPLHMLKKEAETERNAMKGQAEKSPPPAPANAAAPPAPAKTPEPAKEP
jgi:hypothetical protein